jgi:hypothetical protein
MTHNDDSIDGSGTVYVLLNETMPGMVKIGFTTRTSEWRARALQTSGVPRPFVVLWDEYVSNAAAVESQIHEALAEQRVDPRREFFRVSPKTAIKLLMEVAETYREDAPSAGQSVEIQNELVEKYGDIFRPEIMSIEIAVTAYAVQLETIEFVNPRETITRCSDLGFISSGNEPWFSLSQSARSNADRFLELGAFSLIMTTNLVREQEALRINKEENPIYRD